MAFSSSDVVVCYAFEDNAANTTVEDSSANGNDGTAENNTSTMTTTTHKLGDRAFNFQANNDFVTIGGANILGATWSCSFWIRADDVTSEQKFVALKEDDNCHFKFDSGNFQVTMNGAGGDTTVKSSMATATWYHIVQTWDGTNRNVYVNGSNELSDTPATSAGGGVMTIGSDNGGFDFDGIIDEFTIFDIELSSDDVTTLYNSGDGLAYPYQVNNTVDLTGDAISVSTTAKEPIVEVRVINIATSASVSVGNVNVSTSISDPATAGNKEIKTNYPFQTGIVARAYKLDGRKINLIAKKGSTILKENRY